MLLLLCTPLRALGTATPQPSLLRTVTLESGTEPLHTPILGTLSVRAATRDAACSDTSVVDVPTVRHPVISAPITDPLTTVAVRPRLRATFVPVAFVPAVPTATPMPVVRLPVLSHPRSTPEPSQPAVLPSPAAAVTLASARTLSIAASALLLRRL